MDLAELRTAHSLPAWTIGFLRDRCEALQRSLVSPETDISLHAEEDSIHCWRLLLIAAADGDRSRLAALEELHLLHAHIAERMDRGGVGDISQDVEFLVRTVLVDRLQRLTDNALRAIEN
ncbi:hypothetical protein BH23ACT9_BH23ACT9_15300 [soil metagenome]